MSFFVSRAPGNLYKHEESVDASDRKALGWNFISSCGAMLTTLAPGIRSIREKNDLPLTPTSFKRNTIPDF